LAIYRFSIKHGSRAKGTSAGAHARYILREERYNYGAHELRHTKSANIPLWAENSIYFWDKADEFESVNARLYTEFEISLPRELSVEQQIFLAEEFIKNEIGDRHPYTMAMHESLALDGKTNPHIHVMFSTRTIDKIKRGESVFFKRANSKYPNQGGAPKNRTWMAKDRLIELRLSWETHCNRALENAGHRERVDRRKLKEQGIDRGPEPKLTPYESMLWKQGVITERVEWIAIQRELVILQSAVEFHKKAINFLEEIEHLRKTEKELQRLVASEIQLIQNYQHCKEISDRYVFFYEQELKENCCNSWDEAWKQAADKIFGRVSENYHQDINTALQEQRTAGEKLEHHSYHAVQAILNLPQLLGDFSTWVQSRQKLSNLQKSHQRFIHQIEDSSEKQKASASKLLAYTEKVRSARDEAVKEALSANSFIEKHQKILADLQSMLELKKIEIITKQADCELLRSDDEQKIYVVGQSEISFRANDRRNTESRIEGQLKLSRALELRND